MDTLLSKEIVKALHKECKETSLFGKWIVFKNIEPLIQKLKKLTVSQIGVSENKIPIYKLTIGNGKKRILIWSQMHGNESTGTRALFDLLNFFEQSNNLFLEEILENCTLQIIPMLNPDGALAYTRVNANRVDLNRDAVALQAVESRILRTTLNTFNPHFCFNLHDQRTIFGVAGTQKPASISFLAPSEEETRMLTEGRKQTMNVIIAMNKLLQQIIPNSVGRYTDEFYPTATGDNFQKLGHNTILIEAGHFPNDYDREEVRKFNFYALLQGIYHIAKTTNFEEYEAYFDIPNNVKNFFDIIHRYKNKEDQAYQYKDAVKAGKFVTSLEKVVQKDLSGYFSHTEIVFD